MPSFNAPVRLIIFVIAVVVRLIFVSIFSTEPVNDQLWNDAVGWNLAQGNGFTSSQSEPRVPGIYRTPGYPAFLAVIYKFFGHSYDAVFVVQAVLDSISAILIGLIATQYLPVQTATLTSFLYSIYPYPALFCGAIHQDILLVFSSLLVLLFLSRAIKSEEKYSGWLLVGVWIGLTALVKANLILLFAIPVFCILLYFRAGRWKKLAMISCAMLLTLLPWMIRNYVVFGSFPPLAAGATGTNLRLLVVELNGGEEAVRKIGLSPAGRDVTKLIPDGHSLIDSEKKTAAIALAELKKRLPEYSLVVLKHIPRLWITKYSRWYSPKVALAGNILSWVVLVSGLLGMFILHKQWKKLFPLYLTVVWLTLMYAPYTVEARYTLPARPVMLCFVAALLITILQKTFPDFEYFRPVAKVNA